MATIITLYCLVHSDLVEHVFKIRIDKDLDVADLKDEIKKKKAPEFDNFAADKLTLWKVDIPYNDDAVKQLVLEENIVIKKMSPISKVGKYYHGDPADECIHVVIEPPGK